MNLEVMKPTDPKDIIIVNDLNNNTGNVTDEEFQKQNPDMVKVVNGKWMKREDVCFLLKKDPNDARVFHAFDGTSYHKSKTGALVKIDEESRQSRKARKKLIQKYWAAVRMQNLQKEQTTV